MSGAEGSNTERAEENEEDLTRVWILPFHQVHDSGADQLVQRSRNLEEEGRRGYRLFLHGREMAEQR